MLLKAKWVHILKIKSDGAAVCERGWKNGVKVWNERPGGGRVLGVLHKYTHPNVLLKPARA